MRTDNSFSVAITPSIRRSMHRERLVPNSEFMPPAMFQAELRKRVASGEVAVADAAHFGFDMEEI